MAPVHAGKESGMEIPRQIRVLVRVIGIAKLAGATFASADTPPVTPTPTPRSGTLAAYASSITLDRGPGEDQVVITTDNLSTLGEGGLLTTATMPAGEPNTINPTAVVNPKIRERWRRKVLAQSEVLARLQVRRSAIEADIDRIERGRLDSRTLDQLEKAEAKLADADAEIRRAKAQLSRIVRDARKEGAQPGWFR